MYGVRHLRAHGREHGKEREVRFRPVRGHVVKLELRDDREISGILQQRHSRIYGERPVHRKARPAHIAAVIFDVVHGRRRRMRGDILADHQQGHLRVGKGGAVHGRVLDDPVIERKRPAHRQAGPAEAQGSGCTARKRIGAATDLVERRGRIRASERKGFYRPGTRPVAKQDPARCADGQKALAARSVQAVGIVIARPSVSEKIRPALSVVPGAELQAHIVAVVGKRQQLYQKRVVAGVIVSRGLRIDKDGPALIGCAQTQSGVDDRRICRTAESVAGIGLIARFAAYIPERVRDVRSARRRLIPEDRFTVHYRAYFIGPEGRVPAVVPRRL